jgi:DNA-binding MarR family transcriptional regulator
MKQTLSSLLREMKQHWPEATGVSSDLYLSLDRLKHLMDYHAGLTLARHGLTNASFDTLVRLRISAEVGPLSPTEIRQNIMVTSGGMTKILKTLEAKGYIKRIANEKDGRSSLVQLTKEGMDLAEIAMKDVMKSDDQLTQQALSQDDLKDLSETLKNIVDKIEKNAPGPLLP